MRRVEYAWRWLQEPENYFGAGLLAFVLSFILLPTTKQVNGVYYAGLLLPLALVLVFRSTRLAPRTPETWLWLLFFTLAGAAGLWGGGSGQYFKHIGYTLTFVLIASNLASPRLFKSPGFKRAAFWVVGCYIFFSAMFYWATGVYGVGERIIWLPGRMTGPIYSSMWLAACFALASGVWIRERRFFELAAALALSLFCTGYLLQSRSGLVGLVAVPLFLLLADRKKLVWPRVLPVAALLGAVCLTLWYSGVLDPLISRGDALRFTVWRHHLANWQQCGIVRGCGLAHYEVFFALNGNNLKAHAHNIYIAIGVRLGLLPLLAFVATQTLTLLRARREEESWGLYLAVSLVMLFFDGSLIIGNPDELWLLVLLPASLIINRRTPPVRPAIFDGQSSR